MNRIDGWVFNDLVNKNPSCFVDHHIIQLCSKHQGFQNEQLEISEKVKHDNVCTALNNKCMHVICIYRFLTHLASISKLWPSLIC